MQYQPFRRITGCTPWKSTKVWHRVTEKKSETKHFLCILCVSVAQSLLFLAAVGCQPREAAPRTPATTRPTTMTSPSAKPEPAGYKCHYTAEPIKIDGKLGDPAWQHADKITLFYLHNSDRPAPQRTVARMLWDDNYIYVAFQCQDDEIYSPFTKNKDPLWQADVVEVFFGPSSLETLPPVQYEFEFSPNGLMYDSLIRTLEGNGIMDGAKWRSHAKVAATIDRTSDGHDRSWTVEAAIPLSDFAEFLKMPVVVRTDDVGPSGGEVQWRFMLARNDVSKSHKADMATSTSPNINSFHEYQRYLPMRFIR